MPPRRRLHPAPSRRRRLLTALAALTLAAGPSCAPAKSYSFPEVHIDATVNQDGSLSVVERRTFDFHGHFHFAFFTVEHKQSNDVVDFSVAEGLRAYEGGQPEVAGHVELEDPVYDGAGGAKFKATWWFDAQDERRTFTIRYRVLCAVDLYADTAHLLWQFVGQGWEVPTDHARIVLHLPGPAADPVPPRPQLPCDATLLTFDGPPPAIPHVPSGSIPPGETRAWGHGPLQGEVRIPDPQTVVLDVREVPPGTFVEGSVLFPTASVPLQFQRADAARERIMRLEASLVAEANRARVAFLRSEAHRRVARGIGWALLAAMVIGTPLLIVGVRRRDRIPGVPRVLSEPPEEAIRPAGLAIEWSAFRRTVDTRNAFRAQILELARQNVIEIQPLGRVSDAKDYQLTLRSTPADELDATFTEGLFPDGRPVQTNELDPKPAALKKLGDWWEGIFKTAKAKSHLSRKSLIWLTVFAFLVPWVAIPLDIYAHLTGWWLAAAITVGFAAPIVARHFIPMRYPPERAERMARWWAFRRWLKDFSSLPEAPTAAIVIWERYLAFAVALGVADLVEKQVRALVPAPDLSRLPVSTALSAISTPHLSNVFGHVAAQSIAASSVFPHYTSSGSSSSSFSSSGGFGGGFSGGGGFGGGGTGGGAG